MFALTCYVRDTGNTLQVEISREKSVYALQNAIIANHEDSTTIHRAGVLLSAVAISIEALKEGPKKIAHGKRLQFWEVLSDVFPVEPPENTIHIVADLPPTTLALNCLVQGGKRDDAFGIDIHRDEPVDALKGAIIRQLALDCALQSSLVLWEVSVPMDEMIRGSVDELNFADDRGSPNEGRIQPISSSGLMLSSVLSMPLAKNHVHVIFKLTSPQSVVTQIEAEMGDDDVITYLKTRDVEAVACQEGQDAMPPSSLAEPSEYRAYQQETPIYDGRYDAKCQVETTSPPVQLFHPVFGHFLDDLSSDSPIPPDIVNATVRYMGAASAMYDNEDDRARALDPALRSILGCALVTIVNADGSSSNVISMPRAGKIPETVTPLLRESQNEFGAGGCDPSILAGLAAARYWAQPERDVVRNNSCCPTFLLATAGPWFAILGFIYTGKWVVQHLTDFIWVGLDTLNEPRCFQVARVMDSLRRGVERLTEYYDHLRVIPVEPKELHPRFFPSVRAYCDEDGKIVEFKYTRPLGTEAECVVFLARTTTNPPKDVIIKFADRYGEEAHRLLASKNLAPRLFYFGRVGVLDGDPSYKNLQMVVMEYIRGKTLDTMHNARRVTPTLKNSVLDQIQRALNILHEQDYVFGELRRPNVIITEDQGVKLTGFGWVGVHDKTTYPLLIYPAPDWPPGVSALSTIKKEHDEYMMARLLP